MTYRTALAGVCLAVGLLPAQFERNKWSTIQTKRQMCAENPQSDVCRLDQQVRQLTKKPVILNPNLSGQTRPRTAVAATSRTRTVAARRYAHPVELAGGQAPFRFFGGRIAAAAGINLKALRESGGAASVTQAWTGANTPAAAQAMLSLANELDEVWLAFDSPERANQPLVLLKGRFRDPRWKQILPSVYPLSSEAVLFGDGPAVQAAWTRLRTPATLGAIATEAETLSKASHIWITGAPPPAAAKTSGVKRFTVSAMLGEQFAGEVNIKTLTPASAEALLASYESFLKQAVGSQAAELQPLLSAINAGKTDSGVRFRLAANPRDLWPLIESRMAGFAPAVPPQPKATIYGLESGPREVTLTRD